MQELRFEKLYMPMAEMNNESSLPSVSGVVKENAKVKSLLGEEEELFLGYGFLDDVYPYRQQNRYERTLRESETVVCVLENDFLKATFLPYLGGRLHSLIDKTNGRELLFRNPVFRPANLGTRNAWFSGGVEWNIGFVGHTPFTCSPLFTATLETDDHVPVLRMYEYERIRRVTYQMDFFLPETSKMLYCRMRIVNPNAETVPMYWWSNIAVPEDAGSRVVMSADEAYTNRDNIISKTTVPMSGGVDITYSVNNAHCVDFFWHVRPGVRKYVSHIGKDGYGLVQTSTERLKGRKLFVWGQGPGGDRWQQYLTGDNVNGRYIEIQSGLAHTQYECIPMPPNTAWEWMEAYGPVQANPEAVHGEWADAKTELEQRLSESVTSNRLEKMLADTKPIALRPAGNVLVSGSGWGALEVSLRRESGLAPMEPHLDFGQLKKEQGVWAHLLKYGTMPEPDANEIPDSWMLQSEFTALLKKAAASSDAFNWYTWLHLGMIALLKKRFDKATSCLQRSMSLCPSAWAMYGLANLERIQGDLESAALIAMKAAKMLPEDDSLAKEALRMLLNAQCYQKAKDFIDELPERIRDLGRVQLYKAYCLAHLGQYELAETMLTENGGISVPDIREGENSMTELWYFIQEAKSAKAGIPFDRDEATPPGHIDFRMLAEKKEKE